MSKPASMAPQIIFAGAMDPKSITIPVSEQHHLVRDDELEALVKLQKPKQAGASLVLAGVAITSLPQVWDALVALLQGSPIRGGLVIWLVVAAASLVGAIIFGYNGSKGKTDAEKLLENIRERPAMPVETESEA